MWKKTIEKASKVLLLHGTTSYFSVKVKTYIVSAMPGILLLNTRRRIYGEDITHPKETGQNSPLD